jgi:threonine/homoserine/homoserine lactone efflux protein
VVVAGVVIATPGPDTALTIRNTLRGGRRAGVLTGGGVASGQLAWALATGAGVAALLAASRPAFVLVRVLGASYLAFLGLHTLRGALQVHRASRQPGVPLQRASAYRQGFLSNLGNPKMAVFFLSLLPQFAHGGSAFGDTLALGGLFASMTFVWLALYAATVARAGDFLARVRVRRIVEGVTGIALTALGIRLALE